MTIKNPEFHDCECGFIWRHGQSESHNCGPYYRQKIAELRAAAAPQVVADETDLECQIPPFGWRCTRGAGHDGACAAVECPEDVAAVKRGMARLASAPVPSNSPELHGIAAAPVQASNPVEFDGIKTAPVDMLLFCPACGVQHIDRDESPSDREWARQSAGDRETHYWTNPPHRSHLCHGCKHVWRPADVPTNGVASIKTAGSKDSAPVRPVAVPDGWRLVPIVPTPKMVDSTFNDDMSCLSHNRRNKDIWAAMIAACPAAPAAQGDAKDAARLDFVLKEGAFLTWKNRDGSIIQCQLMNQDEDEDFHTLSGPDDRYFNTPRQAIDAAIAAKAAS